jgi:RNA polymerase sporulation-specific sigma factor
LWQYGKIIKTIQNPNEVAKFKSNYWDSFLSKSHDSNDLKLDESLMSLLKEPSLKNKQYITDENALKYLKIYKETGDTTYRDLILNGNVKLMLHLAMKSWIPGFYISDLFQEACIGFIEGLNKYDEKKAITKIGKAKISSYAYFYSKKYVLYFIENNSSSIKFTRRPLRAAQKIKKLIEGAVKEFEVNESYIPYSYMLESSSKNEIRGAMDIATTQISLSSPISDSDGNELYLSDTISDNNEQQEKIEFNLNIEFVYDIVQTLNEKSRRLLLSKYEITDEDFIYLCFEYGIGEQEGNFFVNEVISHLKKSLK